MSLPVFVFSGLHSQRKSPKKPEQVVLIIDYIVGSAINFEFKSYVVLDKEFNLSIPKYPLQ